MRFNAFLRRGGIAHPKAYQEKHTEQVESSEQNFSSTTVLCQRPNWNYLCRYHDRFDQFIVVCGREWFIVHFSRLDANSDKQTDLLLVMKRIYSTTSRSVERSDRTVAKITEKTSLRSNVRFDRKCKLYCSCPAAAVRGSRQFNSDWNFTIAITA